MDEHLDVYELLKLNQNRIHNFNRSITRNEIETAIKKHHFPQEVQD